MNDKEREGALKKFEDTQFQELLDKDTCRTLYDLSKELDVARSTVSERLYVMGIVQK